MEITGAQQKGGRVVNADYNAAMAGLDAVCKDCREA